MRHLEKEARTGGPRRRGSLAAWRRSLRHAVSIKLNFWACKDAWVACCRTLPKSKLLGFAGWCGYYYCGQCKLRGVKRK